MMDTPRTPVDYSFYPFEPDQGQALAQGNRDRREADKPHEEAKSLLRQKLETDHPELFESKAIKVTLISREEAAGKGLFTVTAVIQNGSEKTQLVYTVNTNSKTVDLNPSNEKLM